MAEISKKKKYLPTGKPNSAIREPTERAIHFFNLISNIQAHSVTGPELWRPLRKDWKDCQCKICRLPKSSKRSKLIYSRFSCPCDIDVSISGEEYQEDVGHYGVDNILQPGSPRNVTFESTFDDAMWVDQPESLLSLLAENTLQDYKHSSTDVRAIVSKEPLFYCPLQSIQSDMRARSDNLLQNIHKRSQCKDNLIGKSNSFEERAVCKRKNWSSSSFPYSCPGVKFQSGETNLTIPFKSFSFTTMKFYQGDLDSRENICNRVMTPSVSSLSSSLSVDEFSNRSGSSAYQIEESLLFNANDNHFENTGFPDINGICVNINDSPNIVCYRATMKKRSPKVVRNLMCRPAEGIGYADIELTVHAEEEDVKYTKHADNRKACYGRLPTFKTRAHQRMVKRTKRHKSTSQPFEIQPTRNRLVSPCWETQSLFDTQFHFENDFLPPDNNCSHHQGQTECSLEVNVNCIYPLHESHCPCPRTFHFSRPDVVAYIPHRDHLESKSRHFGGEQDKLAISKGPLNNLLTDNQESGFHKNILKLQRDLTICERNNSNGATTDLDRSAVGHQYNGRVIRVEGDGRCLFRSLVTADLPRLQAGRRDEFGCPERREDAEIETAKADELRAKVVRLMKDNLHFYSQLEKGVINADQPMPLSYQQFLDRLEAMSHYTTMPGDLELNAAAMVLEKQIFVLDTDLKKITTYGQDRYPQSVPLAIRYTKLVADVGHYDAVILDSHNIRHQRCEEDMEICHPPVPCSDLYHLAVRCNKIPGLADSKALRDGKLEAKLSAKQEFFFYRDVKKNQFAIEKPTRVFCNTIQPFWERSAPIPDCNKTNLSRTSNDQIKQGYSGTNPRIQESYCSSRPKRHHSSTSVPARPDSLAMIDARAGFSPSKNKRVCVSHLPHTCSKCTRVKQEDIGSLYTCSRHLVKSHGNFKVIYETNCVDSSPDIIRMSRKRKSQDMNENSKTGRKRLRHYETKNKRRSQKYQARVFKSGRKAPRVSSRSKASKLSSVCGKSKKNKVETTGKQGSQKTSSSDRGQRPYPPKSSSEYNPPKGVGPDPPQLPDAFSKNQCRCFMCKEVVKKASHSWLKCYLCGRVAHRVCVLRESPEWSVADDPDDIYFLCGYCVPA